MTQVKVASVGVSEDVESRSRPLALPLRIFRALFSPGRMILYVILIGAAIQALLVTRVWLQLTGDTDRGGLPGTAYGYSDALVEPFRSFEPTTPVHQEGILEFASLVAIEAYLIATLLALTVLFSAQIALAVERTVVRYRRRSRQKQEQVVVSRSPQI